MNETTAAAAEATNPNNQHTTPRPPNPFFGDIWYDREGHAYRCDGDNWNRVEAMDLQLPAPADPSPCCDARSYSTLRPADAVAHLGESLAAEIERFERETSLRVATIKVKRGGKDEPDVLKSVQCHVRS